MLQKRHKKSTKKKNNLSKKYIPLQCFNKQMIVLQTKKAKKMKKLVFMFVAVAAISFASCGNKTNQAAPVDSDTVATVDTAAIDTTVTDSAAAPAAVDSTVAE